MAATFALFEEEFFGANQGKDAARSAAFGADPNGIGKFRAARK
jgi:hypothetical protein